jgi:hypothetical protein
VNLDRKQILNWGRRFSVELLCIRHNLVGKQGLDARDRHTRNIARWSGSLFNALQDLNLDITYSAPPAPGTAYI